MPTTTYNIDMIIKRVPESTRQEILDTLNEIQTVIYSQDCLQTQKILSTGKFPILETTKGVFEYDAPSDCRRIASIIRRRHQRNGYSEDPLNDLKAGYFRNREDHEPVAARTVDASIDTVAKIYFEFDPGTTIHRYYLVYYIKPTPLLSEDDQLTIPEELHYLVRKAVIALYNTEDYGESDADTATIERVCRKVRNSLNRGFQGQAGETPVRPENQNYDYPFYSGYFGHRQCL